MEFELLEPEEDLIQPPPNIAPQEFLADLLSGNKTCSFEDLSTSIRALLSTSQDISFTVFTAAKLSEYIILKLQDNLTVSAPNPLILNIFIHDISTLLRLFFELENTIKSNNLLANKVPIELKCSKNLFRHFLGYIGSKEDLETQDYLLIDLLRIIMNPPSTFTSTLSETQLISVIDEEISELKSSIFLALSRIFRFLDKNTIVRLCSDPMELIKGILDSIQDIESPIFQEIARFLYSIHLNSFIQKALIRSGIHMILYKLLRVPYQDFRSPNIPEAFHKTRLLCIQVIIDCVSVQSESFIEKFVGNLLTSDARYLAETKRQLFIDQILRPLLKIAPLSNLIPVSVRYQAPFPNKQLFKSPPQEEESYPGSLTKEQYGKLLEYVYAAYIHDEKLDLQDQTIPSGPLGLKWKWRTITSRFSGALQSESCLLIFPCSFEGNISIDIGFYLASPQVSTVGKTSLQSLRNCMFYIVDGQLQFLTNLLRIDIQLEADDLELEAYLNNSPYGSLLFKYSHWLHAVVPLNLYKLDFSSQRNMWTKFEHGNQKQFSFGGSFEFYAGYHFYDINRLQPSYSANISSELIQNATSSDIVYLVPKNFSLQTFAQVLFQDSPDAIKLLQIQHNSNKVLKPTTKIYENFPELILSSSFMEVQVLRHISASPCQVLQRILNHHSDQIHRPLLKPLNASNAKAPELLEGLCQAAKTSSPYLLQKFAALCHQFGYFIDILQTILGDSLSFLLLDFLLEGSTGPKFIPVFSMTVLSHLKFQDTFSVPPNQLFQVLKSLLTSFPDFSSSEYLNQLLSILNSALSQIFFLSDPRVFQSFLNAVLWRTNKDLNQIDSLLSFDKNLLSKEVMTDFNTIQEEKQVWGDLLSIRPNDLNIERLRPHQILEKWTLIFEKLSEKTKSQNLAFQILKILRAGFYESLIKFRFLLQSTNLFNAFQALCVEKSMENPYLFFKGASDNLAMLFWSKSVAQQYLNLKFEAYNYSLFLEVLSLPLLGFKFLKSLLLKDFNNDEGNKVLQAHQADIFAFLQFLQKLGSREFFIQKFENYDIDEFYEQWTAVITSLNIPKTFTRLLCALKDQLNVNSFKDQLFLEILELLYSWSENSILVKMLKFEFSEALENCEDQEMPPNLYSILLTLMKCLPHCAKQELSIEKNLLILETMEPFFLASKENINPNLQPQELITDILSGHKTYSFEDLSISLKTLLSTHKDLPFAAFTATKLFEYITLKLQYHLTVSTPNPLLLDTLLHDISTLLRLFFALESFIKSHHPVENKPLAELKCTKNLFRHFLGYIGSKEDLETQDRLFIDLLRVIINPPCGFTSTLSEAQLISVIEEEISEFKPSIYLSLSRIFQFLDKKTIVRLCNDPMELVKGILDSIEDVESLIFHEVARFLYSTHLNPDIQKALLRSEIHMILYKLLQLPYQDFRSQDIPKTFHKTRLLCIQIIVDCVSVQDEAFIAGFVINLLRSDARYLANSKQQLFVDQIMKPLLKIAPLSGLIPVSLRYKPPLMNQEPFKNLLQETKQEMLCPSSLTQDQYEKLLGHIYAAHINDEAQDKDDNELEKPILNNARAEFQWKWRITKEGLKNALQSESCILLFPCIFEQVDISIKIGFYLGSLQVNTTGKTFIHPSHDCMFYIADGQLQFLSNQIFIVLELHDENLTLEAHLSHPNDNNQFSSLILFKYAPDLQSYLIIPHNMCRADPSPRKDLWTKLLAREQMQFKPGPEQLEVYSGCPFYDINKLQPSYSANISSELIQNATSSDIVYLVPKNISLQTFAQVLFQDSSDAIRFLQIQHNSNKVLKPMTKIDENLSELILSSSFMEEKVLRHMSASPCQVLQRILNQHPDQIQKPLFKFLCVSIENTLQLFEGLGRTIKPQNPNLLRKFAALSHQFGSFMNTLQTLLGESLISLLLDFLLEENTSTKSIKVFSLTMLSHLKFTDTFSVQSNELFQIVNSILTSFTSVSSKDEFEHLKRLKDILNSAICQIFFLSDPRVFQSFMNAILWRTAKDINQLNSLVSFDNNILAYVLTNDVKIIEEEKEIWGEVLRIDPKGIDIERLRAYQLLERWTLIFEKLPSQTKSQKLAFEVLKVLKVCIYESLIKFRLHFQSKHLFNSFNKLCNEKFIKNPQLFFKEALDNISMLIWAKSVAQEYLNLKFEAFNYPLFLEVMTLPLIGFKSLKSVLLLLKDEKETIETQKVDILSFLEFLQKLGSRKYLQEKFIRFDIDEFYEQWTAVVISLDIHKMFMGLLYGLKDQLNINFVKDRLFLEILELLQIWSENKILANIFKIEFAEALENSEDKNAPPNLDSVLFSLMRNLAYSVKQEPQSQQKANVVQITSKALVIIQKTRTNIK